MFDFKFSFDTNVLKLTYESYQLALGFELILFTTGFVVFVSPVSYLPI